MDEKEKKAQNLVYKKGKSSPNMTKDLKELGEGDMQEGLRYLYEHGDGWETSNETQPEPNDISPLAQMVIDELLAPVLTQIMEVGANYLIEQFEDKAVPKIHRVVGKIKNSLVSGISIVKSALRGETTKAEKLLTENTEDETAVAVSTNAESRNEILECTEEQAKLLISEAGETAKKLAFLIKLISIAVVKDESPDSEVLDQLEALRTQSVMEQITGLLEEKNSMLIDIDTLGILQAFRNDKLLVDGNEYQIDDYVTQKRL